MGKNIVISFALILFVISISFSFDEKSAKAIFESKCSMCHPIDWPLERRKTSDGWKETVRRMKKKTAGNVISDEDEKIIVEYLTKVRGK